MRLYALCSKKVIGLTVIIACILALIGTFALRIIQAPYVIYWHAHEVNPQLCRALQHLCQQGAVVCHDQVAQIPALAHIECALKRGKYAVRYTLKQPLVLLPSDQILTTDGSVVNASWFTADISASLPCVHALVSDTGFLPATASFLAHLCASVFQDFDITILSDHQLYLHKRTDRSWSLYTTTDLQSIDELLLQCDQIKERDFAKVRHVVFDARFRGQIVARQCSGDLREHTGHE